MARPPSNKPTDGHKPAEPFVLPAPIPDPQQEIIYYLGHLRGKIITADRIAELYLLIQAQWLVSLKELRLRIAELEGAKK